MLLLKNWKKLQEEVLSRAKLFPSRVVGSTVYGVKYEQKLILYGIKGYPTNVVVGWILQDGAPRLTSAYIKEVKPNDD